MTTSKSYRKGLLWAFLLIFLAGSAWSCKREEPKYSIATQAEVQAFAADLQLALNTKDAAFFKERCDHRRFTDYCYQQMLSSRDLDVATRDIKTGFNFGDYFLSGGEIGQYEIVQMLPVRDASPNYYVFFRHTDTDCNYQYIEARIERRVDETDSRTVMTDFLPYNMGEWFSKIVGENLAAISEGYPKNIEVDERLADRVSEIQDLYLKGDWEAAETAYEELPAIAQHTRSTTHVRLYALMAQDSTRYAEAYLEFKQRFPEQSGRIAFKIAEAWQFADYESGLQALDRLQAFIQVEDAMICYQRANFYYQMDNMYDALRWSKKAVQMEPKVICFQTDLFYTYLQFKDYEGAIGVLEVLNEMEYDLSNVYLGAYPDFVESKIYTDWEAAS